MRKWFFGSLLLLIVGIVFQLGLLMYAMYVFLGILLISRYLARQWTDNLVVNRESSTSTAEIGDKVAVVVTLENKGNSRITWVLVEDSVPRFALISKPPRIKLHGKRTQLLSIKGHGRESLLYQLTFHTHGYYQIGPTLVESGDLFGLHRHYRIATEPIYILVYPKVIPVAGYDVSSRRPVGEIKLQHRLFEDPTRISGVREYQAGDPMNRVHWKATARTGELHSRIYESSSLAGATILLDYHEQSYPARGEPDRSELAVTLAVSLTNAICLLGQQVGLISNARDAADRIREEGYKLEFRTREDARKDFGMLPENTRLHPVRIETARGPEQFSRILETSARLELSDGLTFPQLVAESLTRLPRDASVVAILGDVDEETAIALGNLRRSGYAVSAVLILQDELDYSQNAGLLMAQHIDVRHVEDEAAVADFCATRVLV
ncbi:MAG: DUF58 domain-containing protein [Planctomycetaceae bacterium]|nr:DUF58 domain-containing protein [Planctomycetaceae bacterium]